MGDDNLHPPPPEDPEPTSSAEYVQHGVERARQITQLLLDAQIPPGPVTTLALAIASASAAQTTGLGLVDAIRVYLEVYERTESAFAQQLHDRLFSTVQETFMRVLGNLGTSTKPTEH